MLCWFIEHNEQYVEGFVTDENLLVGCCIVICTSCLIQRYQDTVNTKWNLKNQKETIKIKCWEEQSQGIVVLTACQLLQRSLHDLEGFRPEWYILTIYHCKDIPFWLETLDLLDWSFTEVGGRRVGFHVMQVIKIVRHIIQLSSFCQN